MDTRSTLRKNNTGHFDKCVYCGSAADTKDHSPSRCFLMKPLPSNLITLPACQKCNVSFSFDENVVKALLTLKSSHQHLGRDSEEGKKVQRAIARDRRLREVIELCHTNGSFEVTEDIWTRVVRVFVKMVQGLYFGLYDKVVNSEDLEVIMFSDELSSEDLLGLFRPSPLRDITDSPLPSITEHGWVANEPVFFMNLKSMDSDAVMTRLFRLVRETEVEWINLQHDVFAFCCIKGEDGRLVCAINLWDTFRIAVAAPWPDDRGPLRKGKKNVLSREKKSS